jgi:hypothetical protein
MRLYQRVLAGKWTGHKPQVSSEDELLGMGDDGDYRIRRQGRMVQGVEGMKP